MAIKFTLFYQKVLVPALVLFLLLCTIGSHAQWAQKASLTGTRDGAVSFAIGSKIYCGGGTSHKDFRAYDPVTNTWTQKATIPGVTSERAFAVGVCINGKGYIGLGDEGSTVLADWWEYDTLANTWTQKASYPIGRDACGFFVLNNKVYVCGGTDNNYVYGQCYEYDPATDQWTAKASYPGGAICFPYAFAIGGKGYFSAGSASAEVTATYEYDAATDTWSLKAPFPASARQAGVSFVIDSVVYCGLGMVNYTTPFKQFFTYSAATDQWDTLAAPAGISARAWSSAATHNNKAYVGLGWDLGTHVYNDWWQFSTAVTNTVVATAIPVNSANSSATIVYNNPFSESLSLAQLEAPCSLAVFNALGQLVFSQQVHSSSISLSTSSWMPGLYTLRIKGEGGFIIKKLIKD